MRRAHGDDQRAPAEIHARARPEGQGPPVARPPLNEALRAAPVDRRTRGYRTALREAGLPCIVFFVDGIETEYERLRGLGVRFTRPTRDQGPVVAAVLDGRVGNLVRPARPKE